MYTDFQKMVRTEIKAVHTNLIEQLHFSSHKFYFKLILSIGGIYSFLEDTDIQEQCTLIKLKVFN